MNSTLMERTSGERADACHRLAADATLGNRNLVALTLSSVSGAGAGDAPSALRVPIADSG